jgi:hypothetical protein
MRKNFRSDWREFALFNDVGKLAAAAAVAGLATALARLVIIETVPPVFALCVCGLIFGITYLAAILLLRILSPDERDGATRAFADLQRRTHWRRAANDVV